MKCVVFFSVLTIKLLCENWRVANTQTLADSEDENVLQAAQVSNLCSTFYTHFRPLKNRLNLGIWTNRLDNFELPTP